MRAMSLSPNQAHPEVFILPPPCSAATLWEGSVVSSGPCSGLWAQPGAGAAALAGAEGLCCPRTLRSDRASGTTWARDWL